MVGTECLLRRYVEFNSPRGAELIRRHVGSCEGERLRDTAYSPQAGLKVAAFPATPTPTLVRAMIRTLLNGLRV
jgi:hypothetical protein